MIDVAVQFNGLYNSADQLERVRIALTDISESKRLLREVSEHRQLIDLVINHMSDGILLVSSENQKILTVNRRVGTLINNNTELLNDSIYNPEDFWRTLGLLDEDLFRSRMRYALANVDQSHQEQFEGRNGSYLFRIVPVQNASGHSLAQLWVIQDVTAEVHNRSLLKQQNEQLRTLQFMGETLHHNDDYDDLLLSTVSSLTEMLGVEAAGTGAAARRGTGPLQAADQPQHRVGRARARAGPGQRRA